MLAHKYTANMSSNFAGFSITNLIDVIILYFQELRRRKCDVVRRMGFEALAKQTKTVTAHL